MKKIVALVLSLVMALSLCTVAFAVSNGDTLYDSQTAGKGNSYEYVAAKDNGAGNESWLAYFVGSDGKYYAVGDATGTTLWTDGTTKADVTLGKEVKSGELSYVVKAEAVKASAWSCSTDKYDAGYKYVWSDGKTYYAKDAKSTDTNTFQALVGNEIKTLVDQDPAAGLKGQHVLYAKGGEPKEVGVGVYEAYCVACKKTIQVSDKQINGAGYLYEGGIDVDTLLDAGVTVAVPNGYAPLEGSWYVLGAAATTPAEGVTSAKTFDAGIAMYVGMSLLSVAGGAVVIGKKKEF